jgi:hypothetical protein
VANLQKYQDETRAWRDPKLKLREFEVGDLVVLWRPCTESSGKLESKRVRSYVVTEKSGPGAYHLSDSQGKVLALLNMDNLVIFMFKEIRKK